MHTSTSLRWLVVALSAAMLLAVAAACGGETIEVPGETVVVEKEVIKEVQVPGETVVVKEEVVKTVEVPGETVVVKEEVVKTVEVPGETVVVEKEVVKTVEVPGQTVVVEKEVVKEVEGDRYVRNIWGELVEKPQYGGSIPVPIDPIPDQFDPYYGGGLKYWAKNFVFETPGATDFTLPRDEVPSLTPRYRDISFIGGKLAESWDISPDLLTYTFHIRKGVHWHDKPPVNGRELTAYDFEWTWQRNWGFGEFAEAGKAVAQRYFSAVPVESLTATDKYTVVVKTHTALLDTIDWLTGWTSNLGAIPVPPEVIKEHGDMKDWRNVVGTGPFELTDVVPGSSMTFTKNPNYWLYDPIHPGSENRLPYVDEITMFAMQDMALQIAGLRTGKLVMSPGKQLTLAQANSLMRTNPELVAIKLAGSQYTTPLMRRKPFDDKNVRIAMQKAINLEELNYTYYRGEGDPGPYGFYRPGMVFYTPYSEWPEEVKWQYEYDPAEAERLLDDAGYPRGADGIRFKVGWDVVPPWGDDLDLVTVVTSYFDKIGADVTVNLITDGNVLWNNMGAGTSSEMHLVFSRHTDAKPISRMYGIC